MIWYTVKLILRKIKNSRSYSIINISGLTLGLTCCILALLYIQNELAYDKNFKDISNTYRMLGNNFFVNRKPGINQPARFMEEILASIPEIKSGLRLKFRDANIGIGENNQIVNDILFSDPNFFSFFNLPLVHGDQSTVLSSPLSVVLSESKAEEYFGKTNPTGKLIKLDNRHTLTIKGVYSDFPEHSHIKPEIIVTFSTLYEENPNCYNSWGCFGCNYYLKSIPNVNKAVLDKKLTALWNSFPDKKGGATGEGVFLTLQAFKNIYLKSGSYTKSSQYSSSTNLRAIAIISLFILIIVCFNFVNINTAILGRRNKDTSINKVLGAAKKHFMGKLVFEISIYLLISWILSFLIVSQVLPVLNSFLGKNLSVPSDHFLLMICFILAISTFIILATSFYPILLISKISISGVLKDSSNFALNLNGPGEIPSRNHRDSLVVIQFVFGIILILAAITVNKQMRFIRQRNIGFNKDQILIVKNPYEYPMSDRYKNFKENLEKYPQINSVTSGKNVPGAMIDNWASGIGLNSVDYGYFSTLGAIFIEGRGFQEDKADNNSIVITENLLKLIREEQPEGDLPNIPFNNKEYTIIGVIADMEFNTIHSGTKPALFYLKDSYDYSKNIIIKLEGGDISKGIKLVHDKWKKVAPNWPIEYYFMDELFERNYQKESQIAIVINILTIIAVFLCSLGLFGLSLFTINCRIKEIGIRKINGAKVLEVIAMLNKDFVKWVAIAFIIASPIAWYAMYKWLENFTYKTTLSWWVFALAGVLALGIALLTVSFQSWKAATRNPIESLRYE